MKPTTIMKTLLGAGLLAAAGFESGVIQHAFDSRSVVEDGVVGGSFWLDEVDGKPTERIRHGLLVTRVPFALVPPGEHVMGLSDKSCPPKDRKLVELRATIGKDVRYRIVRNETGNPELSVIK